MQQAQLDTANVSRTSIAIVAVMMVGSFVSILNQNLMTTAIPSLMVVFDVPSSTAQWLTTAFMLANGIMIPVTAFLLRRFSTRALFFLAMGLFGAGTALCAAAFSFEMLLAGRVVQALGAGITMPLMQTVLFVVFPPDKRGTAMGFFGLVIAFAPAIGPTLSGWIVDFFPWQALFLLLLPIIALDLVVAFFVVKNVTERSNPAFDLLSVVLSSVGFGGLLYGLSVAGTLGWTNPEVLIVLAVGLILRFRTAWALTLGVLVLLAGAEFLYVNTVQVAVAALVLLCLLFWKRDAFDRPIVPRDDAPRLVSEFHENLDRFHAWNEARRERAASGEGEDVRTGRGAALAARRAERRDQGRAKRKTGWEQRAEKGAEISRQAQREGILPFGEDVVVSPAGVAGLSVAESAPEKKESQ